jgi:hypothetical protein
MEKGQGWGINVAPEWEREIRWPELFTGRGTA